MEESIRALLCLFQAALLKSRCWNLKFQLIIRPCMDNFSGAVLSSSPCHTAAFHVQCLLVQGPFRLLNMKVAHLCPVNGLHRGITGDASQAAGRLVSFHSIVQLYQIVTRLRWPDAAEGMVQMELFNSCQLMQCLYEFYSSLKSEADDLARHLTRLFYPQNPAPQRT